MGDYLMNQSVLTKRHVGLCLLLLALIGVIVFAGTKAQTIRDPNAEFERALKDLEPQLEEWNRIMAAVEDEHAEESYRKKGSEITPWMKEAALPRPDNAALLYYQAFLLRPEPNMATSSRINEVLQGGEPDRQIRIYLGYCLPMIRLAEIASQIPQCTWGLWNGLEPMFREGDLVSQMRRLTFILALDARTLAVDGHYRAALARCLTMRRLARHIDDDTMFLHLASMSPDVMALRTAKHVLGVMPPDVETLMWFRGQLVAIQGVPVTFAEILQAEFESTLYRMRTDPTLLAKLRNQLVEKAEDKQVKENAQNLTDEQLVSRAREPYARFLNSVLQVIDGDMSDKQKHTQMRALADKLLKEYGNDPVVAPVIFACNPEAAIDEWYPRLIGHTAHCNGLRAALEVYLIASKTGRLPEKLPEYLPKDPFTGRDFGYEITDEGFALRCQGKEYQSGKSRWLEFKVRK